MKADVIPAKTPRLEIPSWVPDIIAQSVSARYAADVDRVYEAAFRESDWFEHEHEYDDVPREYRDELIRDDAIFRKRITELVHDDLANINWRWSPLVCDPRMESVWLELSKHVLNGGFLHPAIDTDQDKAMLELFNVALGCRNNSIMMATTTQRQAKIERNHYLTMAAKLKNDSFDLAIESPRGMSLERYQKLQDAAQAYEDHANEVFTANMPMALERKHDGQARWVALTIGNKFHSIFGKSMYRLTATIVSVVLDREIKFGTVCKWLQTTA